MTTLPERSYSRRRALAVLAGAATVLAACSAAPAASAMATAAPSATGQASTATATGRTTSAVSQAATRSTASNGAAATVATAGAAAAPTAAGSPATPLLNPGVISWVHIGDLHITTADQQNYQDLQTIVAHINQYLKNGVNFAFCAGDTANDDTAAEYQLIKAAVAPLQVPLHIVPGDHDSKDGQALYKQYLGAPYSSFSKGGYHCAFLDMLDSSANGHPGFGIGSTQMSWLKQDLATAKAKGETSILFGHTYNLASLGTSGAELQSLLVPDHVIMLDAGHTHYNDVANDGHVIYATGRNTGQVTEGPVGFVIVNVDNGVVSWKFKPLGSWPFVMVTSPADKLLIIDPAQAVKGTVQVRAKVWDDKGVASATMQVDGGTAVSMQRIGSSQMWQASLDASKLTDGDHKIAVNVKGLGGNTSSDVIDAVVQNTGAYTVPQRQAGESGNSIGAYTEKGLLGSHSAGGPGGPGGPGPKGAGGPGGPGPATITAVNGNTLTLQYANGTTQQVTLASGATVAKVVSGSAGDLKAGEKVVAQVTTNADGSKTVSSIEIEQS
jgi:Icc protein